MADATWNALRAGIEALREYTDTCEALDAMEAALAAQQPAQGEAVAWRDFPEQVPDPDTECLVEVDTGKIRYRAVDTWEMQSECPVEWSSATIETGYDWSAYPGDVRRWIPISSITAPPAPSVSVPMAPPVVFAEWLRSNMPPDTIISDPDWWAMAIWSAARRAINAAPVASGGNP